MVFFWLLGLRYFIEYHANINLLMRFEYADARTPASMTRDGVKYYLIYDQVGSLRIIADSSGNVVKRIDYDSFGNIVSDSNPAFRVPFGFAGGLYDPDTGLVRFGFRDYDPDTGRWTAKDPIFFAGGDTNLYGYVLNDPVSAVDLMGLKGGILIPIRTLIKNNVTGLDIATEVIGSGLSIPTSVFGILTYDFLNPTEAGVVSEDFLIYQWEKAHYPDRDEFNLELPSMIDLVTRSFDEVVIAAEPCK